MVRKNCCPVPVSVQQPAASHWSPDSQTGPASGSERVGSSSAVLDCKGGLQPIMGFQISHCPSLLITSYGLSASLGLLFGVGWIIASHAQDPPSQAGTLLMIRLLTNITQVKGPPNLLHIVMGLRKWTVFIYEMHLPLR